jgi:hypothetical protein
MIAEEQMAVTTKLQDEANDLLEFYLGHKRMKGERVNKEDAVAAFVTQGIRSALPKSVIAQFEKSRHKPATRGAAAGA